MWFAFQIVVMAMRDGDNSLALSTALDRRLLIEYKASTTLRPMQKSFEVVTSAALELQFPNLFHRLFIPVTNTFSDDGAVKTGSRPIILIRNLIHSSNELFMSIKLDIAQDFI